MTPLHGEKILAGCVGAGLDVYGGEHAHLVLPGKHLPALAGPVGHLVYASYPFLIEPLGHLLSSKGWQPCLKGNLLKFLRCFP